MSGVLNFEENVGAVVGEHRSDGLAVVPNFGFTGAVGFSWVTTKASGAVAVLLLSTVCVKLGRIVLGVNYLSPSTTTTLTHLRCS